MNLTLRVSGRRADGYHTLESLIAFADLADELSLEFGGALALDVSGPFAAASGPASQNLIIKAAAALAERVPALKLGRFALTKNIPVAAGLGGGSADAAAALRLLARSNGIAPTDPRLFEAALASGADVPVCLESKARVASGIGEELSDPVTLPQLPAVLVNPGVALKTATVFADFDPTDMGIRPARGIPAERAAALDWLTRHRNDLAPAAIARVPVIADVIASLEAKAGCRFARMTGSGATCFGLFETPQAAADAAEQIAKVQTGWWLYAGVLN